jgi:CheY-like chemotaxis protein/HPt (histidine-containing phosphotransfer) domain-containing protein
LLAEDNAVNQRVALHMLSLMGYMADVAADGAEALAALGRQRYDLVLMDVQMPLMDGLEATRRIREQFSGDEAPRIIAMTAGAMSGDREKCLAAGMDDYLTKPIRPADLQAALLKWGGAASARRQAQPAPVEPAPEAAGAAGPHAYPRLDLEGLMELRAMQAEGEPDILAELAGIFLRDTARRLGDLRHALSRGDAKEARRLAHTIKGSSLNLGAPRMAALCTVLESEGGAGSFDDASATAARLADEFSHVSALLESLLREHSSNSTRTR